MGLNCCCQTSSPSDVVAYLSLVCAHESWGYKTVDCRFFKRYREEWRCGIDGQTYRILEVRRPRRNTVPETIVNTTVASPCDAYGGANQATRRTISWDGTTWVAAFDTTFSPIQTLTRTITVSEEYQPTDLADDLDNLANSFDWNTVAASVPAAGTGTGQPSGYIAVGYSNQGIPFVCAIQTPWQAGSPNPCRPFNWNSGAVYGGHQSFANSPPGPLFNFLPRNSNGLVSQPPYFYPPAGFSIRSSPFDTPIGSDNQTTDGPSKVRSGTVDGVRYSCTIARQNHRILRMAATSFGGGSNCPNQWGRQGGTNFHGSSILSEPDSNVLVPASGGGFIIINPDSFASAMDHFKAVRTG